MAKTIRLLVPILSGTELIENNCVVDATNEAADLLLNHEPPYAELTDAIERHPTVKLLHTITRAPVDGSEKFPLPDDHETTVTPAQFTNHADALVEKRIKVKNETTESLSKEPVAAKVEVTKEMKAAEKEVEAKPATPPVVVTPTPKPAVTPAPKDKP